MGRPTRLFISYVAAEGDLLDRLLTHLAPLQQRGLLEVLHDGMLHAGDVREATIERYVTDADVIVALISPDYLAIGEGTRREVAAAVRRAEAGTARFVPILVRHSHWQDSPIGRFEPLPKGGQPLSMAHNEEHALHEISSELSRIAEEARGQRDLMRQVQLLKDEVAELRSTNRQLQQQKGGLDTRIERLEHDLENAAAAVQQRVAGELAALRSSLADATNANDRLKAGVADLTRQLGDAARQREELIATVDRFKQQSAEQRDSIKQLRTQLAEEQKKTNTLLGEQRKLHANEIQRLRAELNRTNESLQLIENRRLVRAEILNDGLVTNPPQPDLVRRGFRLRNTGEGPIRLLFVEINWAFAPPLIDSLADILGSTRPPAPEEPLLPESTRSNFEGAPVVAVGATSQQFLVQFEINSLVARHILQQHPTRVTERSVAGWGKALRAILVVHFEGESTRHADSIKVVLT